MHQPFRAMVSSSTIITKNTDNHPQSHPDRFVCNSKSYRRILSNHRSFCTELQFRSVEESIIAKQIGSVTALHQYELKQHRSILQYVLSINNRFIAIHISIANTFTSAWNNQSIMCQRYNHIIIDAMKHYKALTVEANQDMYAVSTMIIKYYFCSNCKLNNFKNLIDCDLVFVLVVFTQTKVLAIHIHTRKCQNLWIVAYI